MPFSSQSGKPFLIKFFNNLINFHPELIIPNIDNESIKFKICDYGCGSGTYSKLFKNNIKKLHSNIDFDGIEIYEPYIEKYNLKNLYDNFYNYSIKDHLDNILDSEENNNYYSCAILGDVVEHLSLQDAIEIHEQILDLYGFSIISIPLGYYPQDEYDGNIYEKHITNDWSHEKVLSTFKNCVNFHIENEIGIYIFSKNELLIPLLKDCVNPKIGVYIIAKNEEEFIERCINSCREADEIVVVDTGSSDNTLSILNFLKENAPDFNNKLKIYSIHINPWRFDEAKNSALMLCNEHLDLVISLDSDELLDKNWKLKLLNNFDKNVTRYNHRFETYWNWNKTNEIPNKSSHWHDRIHLRHGYRWKLPVHEVLQYEIGKENVKFCNDLYMYQLPDTSKSRSSYLPLLELSVKEDPNIWKSWCFLSQEYIDTMQYNQAIDCLNKAIMLNDSDKAFLYYSKAKIYEKLIEKSNINIIEAKKFFNEACLINENIREYFVYASVFCNQFGFIDDCKYYLNKAINCNIKTDGYTYNPWCWSKEFDNFANSILTNERK